MRKSKFSDEQIVAILAQEAARNITQAELCRRNGISRQTLQRWLESTVRYLGIEVDDALEIAEQIEV